MKINRLIVRDLNNNGVDISFDQTKKNIITANEKFGKTLMINIMLATIGNRAAYEKLFGTGGIRTDISSTLFIEIGSESFEIGMNIIYRGNAKDSSKSFWIKATESKIPLESSTLYNEYILKKIEYPAQITWDGEGRKTALEDLIAPFYIDQAWTSGVGASMQLRYKPSNRVAASLAFESEEFRGRLMDFYKNEELIFDMVNYNRLKSSKEAVKRFLKKSVVGETGVEVDKLYSQKISVENEIKSLKEFARAIANDSSVSEYKRNVFTFNKFIRPELELILGDKTDEVSAVITDKWLTSLFGDENGKVRSKVMARIRGKREKLNAISNQLAKFSPNFEITQEYYNHIEKSINGNDNEYSKEQIDLFEGLKTKWGDLYSDIRNHYQNYVGGKNSKIKFTDGFGFDKSASGTNKQEFIIYVLDFFHKKINKDAFVIWDSVFQNDNSKSIGQNLKEPLTKDLIKIEVDKRIEMINSIPTELGIYTNTYYAAEVMDGIESIEGINSIHMKGDSLFSGFETYN